MPFLQDCQKHITMSLSCIVLKLHNNTSTSGWWEYGYRGNAIRWCLVFLVWWTSARQMMPSFVSCVTSPVMRPSRGIAFRTQRTSVHPAHYLINNHLAGLWSPRQMCGRIPLRSPLMYTAHIWKSCTVLWSSEKLLCCFCRPLRERPHGRDSYIHLMWFLSWTSFSSVNNSLCALERRAEEQPHDIF